MLYCIAAAGLPLSSALLALLWGKLSRVNPVLQLLIYDCAYYLPFVVLPVWIYSRKRRGLLRACRPDGFGLGRLILITLMAGCLFFLCNDMTALWAIPFQKLGLNIYAGSYPAPGNAAELVLYTIAAAAIPAVCEELLFRGVMFSALETMGTYRAMVITAVLFALSHGSILGLPAEVLAGLFIACVTLSCDSIYAGMALHTIYNTITVVMDYRYPTEAGADLLASIGGFPGVLSLAFDILLFSACCMFLHRSMLARARMNGLEMIPSARPEKLRPAEIICLCVAAIAVLLLYLTNILSML